MSDNPDEENTSEKPPFFKTLLTNSIKMIVYTLIGALILYNCKIAGVDLIPTDINCKPYVRVNRASNRCSNYGTVTSNINLINIDDEIASAKLDFDYQKMIRYYTKGVLFKQLMNLKEGPQSTELKNYIGSVIQSAIQINLLIYSNIYSTLNNLALYPIGETFIIFVIPHIMQFFVTIMMFLNGIIIVILLFYKLNLFFWTKNQSGQDGPVTWTFDSENVVMWKYALYIFGLFICLLIFGLLIMFIAPVIAVYAFLLPLYMTGSVRGSEGKTYNIGKFISDTLKFKKHVMMYMFIFYLIVGAYQSYDAKGGVTALVVAIVCGFFFKSMFAPTKPGPNDFITKGLAENGVLTGSGDDDAEEAELEAQEAAEAGEDDSNSQANNNQYQDQGQIQDDLGTGTNEGQGEGSEAVEGQGVEGQGVEGQGEGSETVEGQGVEGQGVEGQGEGSEAVEGAEPGAEPESEAVVPADNTVIPGNEAVATDNTVIPGNEAVAPADNTVTPGSEAVVPADNTVIPGNEADNTGTIVTKGGGIKKQKKYTTKKSKRRI
jgi:hypothetical protein